MAITHNKYVKDEKSAEVLGALIQCQHVDPYRGWDLTKIRNVRDSAEALVQEDANRVSVERVYLVQFLACRTDTGGWSITHLNKLMNKVRAHFGLSSVKELNPGIEQMGQAIEKTLHDPESPFHRFRRLPGQKDPLPKIETFMSADGHHERRELFALAVLMDLTPEERERVYGARLASLVPC